MPSACLPANPGASAPRSRDRARRARRG
jgi:hypothetical protein